MYFVKFSIRKFFKMDLHPWNTQGDKHGNHSIHHRRRTTKICIAGTGIGNEFGDFIFADALSCDAIKLKRSADPCIQKRMATAKLATKKRYQKYCST